MISRLFGIASSYRQLAGVKVVHNCLLAANQNKAMSHTFQFKYIHKCICTKFCVS